MDVRRNRESETYILINTVNVQHFRLKSIRKVESWISVFLDSNLGQGLYIVDIILLCKI